MLLGRSNVGKSTLLMALTGKRVRSGRRPGVTRRSSSVQDGALRYVDMPGFGFMSGVPATKREEIKTRIVRDLEENRDMADLSLLVLDAKAFVQIHDRWERRGELPIDVEMHDLLRELGLDLIVVANRMDKVEQPDSTLDSICDRLGYLPPWRQWGDVFVPVSAKTGEGISDLKRAISSKLGLS
jgi:small GTP-binding protein